MTTTITAATTQKTRTTTSSSSSWWWWWWCSSSWWQSSSSREEKDKDRVSVLLQNVTEGMTIVGQLTRHVWEAAWKSGQTLPILTVLLGFQTVWYLLMTTVMPRNSSVAFWGALLWWMNAVVTVVGFVVLGRLYCHTIPVVFNKRIPARWKDRVASLGVYLHLLRPLEVTWRWLTCRWRVLPDVVVLGEVRCGTTNLCHHLSHLQGCHTPFCLWKHPELDHKETFYFVGHYCGWVAPQHYRLCFPLQITQCWYDTIGRWWRTGKSSNAPPFFTLDGCAQYLSSPTAPHLLAQAYRMAGEPPPVVVACVRDARPQALSWWTFEQAAMTWAREDMALTEWHVDLRSRRYPPATLEQAWDYATSQHVAKLHHRAEALVTQAPTQRLPPWALTWPGGQLAGMGRHVQYATNIARYERILHQAFDTPRTKNPEKKKEKEGETHETHHHHNDNNTQQNHAQEETTWTRLPQHVTVVPLEWQTKEDSLRQVLTHIMTRVQQRQEQRRGGNKSTGDYQETVAQTARCATAVHRNATNNDDKDSSWFLSRRQEDEWKEQWDTQRRALQNMIPSLHQCPKETLEWLY